MPAPPNLRFPALVLAAALAACGSSSSTLPADAAPTDATIDAVIDAAIDAPPGASRVELTGGGRATGGTLTAEIQLGVPLAPVAATGGALTTQPALPIAR